MNLAWPVAPLLAVLALLCGFTLVSLPPIIVFVAGSLGLVGLVVARSDPILGLFVVLMAVRAVVQPLPMALDTSWIIAMGVLVLVAARETPAWARGYVSLALVTVGVIQVALAVVQGFGYDPMWFWTQKMSAGAMVNGLLPDSNQLGAFLAATAAIAPMLLLPLWILGLLMSKSLLAGVAMMVCLLTRFRAYRWGQFGILLVPAVLLVRGFDLTTGAFRLGVWDHGLRTWLTQAPVFGFGEASWFRARIVASKGPLHLLWGSAHNEYLQLGYETGLVGLALLVAWLWWHREAFAACPFGPALAAIAVDSLGNFPFQVPGTALTFLVLIGLGTHGDPEWPRPLVLQAARGWVALRRRHS